MFTFLALLTVAAPKPQDATVEVLTPSGRWEATDAPLSGRALLPLTTLDDTLMRPSLEPDGTLRVRFASRACLPVRVQAWVHGTDEFVSIDERGAVVFGDLKLPHSVRDARADAPAVDLVGRAARRDRVTLDADAVRVTPPADHGGLLLAFGLPSAERAGAPTATQHLRSEVRGTEAFVLEDASDLDALYFVEARTPDAAPTLETRTEDLDGGAVEVAIRPTPGVLEALQDGRSVTLVLAFTPPTEAAAPSGPVATDAAPPLSFIDAADAVGLRMAHLEGPTEQLDIRPTMGPGAAWGDVDGDGWLDLFVPQGAGRPECAPLQDRLWLGRADGTFRDATAASGLGAGDAGMGALFVDLDGDAHLDLYCANYGRDRLFLGRGDGTFDEATDLLPGHDLWSAAVVAGDPDGDGDLDLYVTSYLEYDLGKTPDVAELDRYQREDPLEMLPFAFPGQRNVFLRNTLAEDGALGFVDVTEELGLVDLQGRGMQAVFWDFDLDGDEDLYVANDVSFNVLYRNEGDGTFEDVSFAAGLDDPRGGMGLALGDVDGDGDEDLFLTNWELEANALYTSSAIQRGARKRRRANFHDATVRSGLGRSGIGRTSWGAELSDFDLDGALDLYVANGYTSPDYESTGICVGQPDLLFRGDGRGRFEEVALGPEPLPLELRRSSRSAIAADHDRDGVLDLVVTNNNGPVQFLRNGAPRRGAWLGVRLRRGATGNRFGIGARVTVRTPDGRTLVRVVRGGYGYISGNAPEVHFGLGTWDEEGPLGVEVRWPDGTVQSLETEPERWLTVERED